MRAALILTLALAASPASATSPRALEILNGTQRTVQRIYAAPLADLPEGQMSVSTPRYADPSQLPPGYVLDPPPQDSIGKAIGVIVASALFWWRLVAWLLRRRRPPHEDHR
jgi:phytoene dehydrogenase-like protein